MKRFWEAIKKRPVTWGLVLLALVVLFFVFARGGGDAGAGAPGVSGPSEALQAKQLEANTQLSALQMQAQGATQLASIESQTMIATAQIQAEAQDRELSATLAGLQSQIAGNIEAARLDRDVSLATISSQEETIKAQLEASVARDALIAETTVAQQRIQSDAMTQMWGTQLAAQVEGDRIRGAVDIARTGAGVEVERIQADASKYGAKQQASAQKSGSRWGAIGGIAGAIAGIFSDVRVKEDMRQIGEFESGVPMYAYRYRGSRAFNVGAMANDVARIAPEQIIYDPSGRQVVLYGYPEGAV